jgi:hypothetical protein
LQLFSEGRQEFLEHLLSADNQRQNYRLTKLAEEFSLIPKSQLKIRRAQVSEQYLGQGKELAYALHVQGQR